MKKIWEKILCLMLIISCMGVMSACSITIGSDSDKDSEREERNRDEDEDDEEDEEDENDEEDDDNQNHGESTSRQTEANGATNEVEEEEDLAFDFDGVVFGNASEDISAYISTDIPQEYVAILDTINYILSNYDNAAVMEQYAMNEYFSIVELLGNGGDSSDVGYLLFDSNGNGNPELYIITSDGSNYEGAQIVNAWSIQDGVAVSQFEGYDRYSMSYIGNGFFRADGSSGAAYISRTYYEWDQDDNFVFIERYFSDVAYDEMEATGSDELILGWFYTTNEETTMTPSENVRCVGFLPQGVSDEGYAYYAFPASEETVTLYPVSMAIYIAN